MHSLIDDFSYTTAATKGLGNGAGNNFSIDNGTSLRKLFNNAAANGFESRDWAPGTNDAFNQFSNAGVVNPVSTVDLRLMDVIGYDREVASQVPEPSTWLLLGTGFVGLLGYGWQQRQKAA